MGEDKVSGWKPDHSTVSTFLYLCAAGLVLAGLISFTSGRASPIRIVILSFAIILSGGLCFIAWQIKNKIGLLIQWDSLLGKKVQIILIALNFILLIIGWIVIWTPLESFGGYYYYILNAYPFVVWLTCSSAVALILLLSSHFGFNFQRFLKHLHDRQDALLIAAGLFLIFAILAWIASFRVVGVKPIDEDFWYGAGVPVLTFQVLAALITGIGVSLVIEKWVGDLSKHAFQINLFLFLLIWLVFAVFWAKEPVKPDFLITQPVAPNFEMYPDYDARNYDVMSQFALIGQGINNHSFFDRVLYPAFITYLHTFGGQDYSSIMALQSALFAILPALLYLIGSSIYNRTSGLSLGILAGLRGINQINIGNIIETAHQKHMLTEYPTAILLVLTAFLLIKWIQNPTKNWTLAGIAGGIIGISTLLRPHTLVIIPIFIILAFLVYRKRTRIGFGVGTLFLLSALLVIMPWIQFGGQNISIFRLYFTRIEDVIRQRYPDLLTPEGRQSIPVSEIPQGSLHQALYNPELKPDKSILAFTADNFLNNLVTAVESLPTSMFNLEPREVVKKTENFWIPYWDGKLSNWAKLLIPFNLMVLALGLGAAWKRARLGGLIPLLIMVFYFVINALGRTSGGRYLVPADWVILIYYVLGLVAIFELISSVFVQTNKPVEKIPSLPMPITPWWKVSLLVLLISITIGSSIPIAQLINPQRYKNQPPAEQSALFASLSDKSLGLTPDEIQKFLSSENAVIFTGRSLYPRQFNKDEGLDVSVYNFYHSMPFPRTLFTVIGPLGEKVIILPRTEPAQIPNSTDVMVLGCQADGFVMAWAVARLDERSVYGRIPSSTELTCPLPDPICDNNKSCH
jgi:hypothetical protein